MYKNPVDRPSAKMVVYADAGVPFVPNLIPERLLVLLIKLMFEPPAFAITSNEYEGLAVPTPTFPFLSTKNEVAVEDPTTNPG